MKIVHICLNGPVTDGWNYQENMLTKYHKKLGLDVTIITSKWVWNKEGKLDVDDRNEYINEDGVRVIRLSIKGKSDLNRKLKKYDKLYQTIADQHPDILFIHNVSCLDDATIAKYLKENPKVVAYADNHADLSNSGTNWISRNILHKKLWRYEAQKLVPYVKKFYGVLPARVDFLVDMYGIPREKCELLVMGGDDEIIESINSEGTKRRIRMQYGIKDSDFLIMTGGKIDQWKTQTLLLMKAVKQIDRENIKLIVFGSVTQELINQVRTLADGEKVQYIGWIQAKQSYEHFAAADLVVFPGRHSVFWEQVVAQGIPMLVKDWSGTHHVDLGGNVRFLTRDSAEEIQEVIEDIINEPEVLYAMKQVAVEKGMKEFSYENIAKRSIEMQ